MRLPTTLLGASALSIALAAPNALAMPAGNDRAGLGPAVVQANEHRNVSDMHASTALALAEARKTTPPAQVSNAGDDGVATLPFVLSIVGAVGLGAAGASGLQVVQGRRRRAAGLT
jgi:hypothetical protein